MGILSGVVSYLFGLCLNLLDAAVGGFLGALGFDLDTFESYFPAAKEYYEVIIGFAIGILLIMLVFQIFRNFGVMLDMEAEDPLKMVGKSILFFGMIISSRSIVNTILGLLTDPYAIFMNTASDPYDFELMTLATSMFTSVFSNPFMSIVALILMIVMGWQFLKLTVECVERYIFFYFILYCAPVVFATGAFKSTAQIFKSWCRMLASQAMLLLLNIWSIKLFLSFMPVFESNSPDIIFYFLLGFAFLKFSQKADTLLRILGLNTASTGDMVRSLGGTIAGIAMSIKSATGMAKGAASAAGKIFGGGAAASGTGGGSGGGGNGGSDVGGMSGGNQNPGGAGKGNGGTGSGSGDSGPLGGVTGSGISAAKQNYINDAINSARSQMMGGAEPEGGGGGGGSSADGPEGFAGGNEPSSGRGSQEQGGVTPPAGPGGDGSNGGPNGNIAMEPGKAPGKVKDPAKIDAETREGLSNIAHGMPHDKYDPVKKSFSGGGFPEFTGEKANIIGASQFAPADGFSQSVTKMADGTTGTVYQNQETGEASVVQFASVDNGVVQGTISEIDPSTGQMGEDFAFKAVHSSVPGADSFSSSTVPVPDGSGGTYHVSTGAGTSFFSKMSEDAGPASAGSAYAPGGTSKMAGKTGGQSGSTTAATDSGYSPGPGADSPGAPPMSGTSGSPSTPPMGGSGGAASPAPPAFGGGQSSPGGAGPSSTQGFPSGSGTGGLNSGRESVNDGARSGWRGRSQGASVHDEMTMPSGGNADSPPVHTGMKPPENQVSRFSKNNPANVEVFRRDHGSVESFDKGAQGPDAAPTNIDPPQKP